LRKDFNSAIKTKYNTTEDSAITKTIDNFQEKFKCCGFDSWRDWEKSDFYTNNRFVPKSCCKPDAQGCPVKNNPDPDHYFRKVKYVVTVFFY